MKNRVLFLLGFLMAQTAFSQNAVPPYKQNKNIPSFELQQVNNTIYKSSQLKKDAPVLIMFFSPGCDHCIHQFEDMMKRKNDFKKVQIVMATIQPTEELAAFNKKYQISQYSNIVTGRDLKFFLPSFYEISNFPYMAFYKQGKLVSTFEGNMGIDNMLKNLN